MKCNVLKLALGATIKSYQFCVSPFLGPSCRYLPSCSDYALEAIELYGVGRGSWLAVRRILRCQPFGASGYDPVPSNCRHVRGNQSPAA